MIFEALLGDAMVPFLKEVLAEVEALENGDAENLRQQLGLREQRP